MPPGSRPRRTAHLVSKPPRLFAHGALPRMCMDAQMHQLRRHTHLSQTAVGSHLPLLRLHAHPAIDLPCVRTTCHRGGGLRHRAHRGRHRKSVPRRQNCPNGPRHHTQQNQLRTHNQRVLGTQVEHSCGHADGDQGPRLRRSEHCGHTQCRHHDFVPRLPQPRARLQHDGAGGWPCRTKACSGAGGDANQRPRASGGEACATARLPRLL